MNKLTESVLVVEDDAALREALIDTLHSAGLAVLGACDAPTALRRLGIVQQHRQCGVGFRRHARCLAMRSPSRPLGRKISTMISRVNAIMSRN